MSDSLFPALKTGRLPISLVTGFLGSGKTTLINRLMRHKDMANCAVVVNEFGEVALDQHFIAASDGEVVVLANGCVCCTAQGELDTLIGTLFAKRQSGGAPFDRMVIETTGLADPAPIVEMLLQPLIADNFMLDAVVTTADAIHGAHSLAEHDEAVQQAALADRLVITKTDLAGEEAVDDLAGRLRDLNQSAEILRVPEAELAPQDLFGAGLVGAGGRLRDPAAWLGAAEAQTHAHAHAGHLHGIETFALSFDQPVAWRRFQRFLTRLKVDHAAALLRVKGIVAIAGEAEMLAIHGVHHVFHPPERLPQGLGAGQPSRLVFITKGPLREAIEAAWRASLAASP